MRQKLKGGADIHADNNIVIKVHYSVENNDRLKKAGFFYKNERKGHVKKFSKDLIPFILSHDFTISVKLAEKIREFEGELNALSCHSDKLGQGVDFKDLIIPPLPAQLVTLKFIRANNGRCIIGHEWGGGKLLPSLMFANEQEGSVLIVCDNLFKEHVKFEIERFFFDSEEFLKRVTIRGHDQIQDLINESFETVVIDESHRMKDLKSKRYSNICKITKKSQNCLLLTGDNISRWPIEFYSQLKILGFNITKEKYIDRFFDCTFEAKRKIPGKLREEVLRNFISPFYIRKQLSEIWPSGKARVEKVIAQLTADEEKFYSRFLKEQDPIVSSKTVISINRYLSLLKVRHAVRFVEAIMSVDSSKKIAIVSQFELVGQRIVEQLKIPLSIYDGGDISKFPVIFVNSSKYKESFTINDRSNVVIIDSFATKLNDIQLKRRFYRIGTNDEVLFTHITTTKLDHDILNMPEFTDYLKMNLYIEKKISESLNRVA